MSDPNNITVTVFTYKGAADATSSHARESAITSKTQETISHTLTDDAVGGFGGDGSINYAGKSLVARLVSLDSRTETYKSDATDGISLSTGGGSNTRVEDEAHKGGEYSDTAVGEQVLAASTLEIEYAVSPATPTAATQSFKPDTVTIDLCPLSTDYIVPNSVLFTWMGHTYQDFDGVVVRDRTNSDPGVVAGQLDYGAGIVHLFDYIVGGPANSLSVQSLWTVRQNWNTASVFMRTQAAPVKPSGFAMNLTDSKGNALTASAGPSGELTGPHMRGHIEYLTGIVELQFGDFVLDSALTPEEKLEWWYSPAEVGVAEPLKIWRPWPVDPTTLRYNSVTYFYLPIDAELLGLDPVRLPPDGRVPIFRRGGFVVVGHTKSTTQAVSNGTTLNLGRVRVSRVRVTGSDGSVVDTAKYTQNLDAGTVTFTNVAGVVQPVTVEDRVEDLVVVADVQINGQLSFTRALTHDYPPGSSISSALMMGDLRSRVSIFFDQLNWDETWRDTQVGSSATGTYNDVSNPILVTNAGAQTERWALRFVSTSSFQIIGEHLGVIGTGSVNEVCAPINPVTGTPYFSIAVAGWGQSWIPGNVVRLNTVGAMFPLWLVRTVQQGAETILSDSFTTLVRGGVDRP